jgi:hypothetical protein
MLGECRDDIPLGNYTFETVVTGNQDSADFFTGKQTCNFGNGRGAWNRDYSFTLLVDEVFDRNSSFSGVGDVNSQ